MRRKSREREMDAIGASKAKKFGGRPAGFRRAPLVNVSRPVSRVLEGMRIVDPRA
jgi:hypothetical protein